MESVYRGQEKPSVFPSCSLSSFFGTIRQIFPINVISMKDNQCLLSIIKPAVDRVFTLRSTLPLPYSKEGLKMQRTSWLWDELKRAKEMGLTVQIDDKICQYQNPEEFFYVLEEEPYILECLREENIILSCS